MAKPDLTVRVVMQTVTLVYAVIVGLAGCDAVTNYVAELAIANEPTILIAAGYWIEVAGRPVPVEGFDECPKQDGIMAKLSGPAPDEGNSTCIVLAKDRAKVPVLVALPTGAAREDRDIIRDTGKAESGRDYSRTSLRRPDASLVVPAAIARS